MKNLALFGNSSALLHMKGHSSPLIPITRAPATTLWWSGKMGRLPQSLSAILLLVTLSLVLYTMHETTNFWMWKDGNDSMALPNGRKSYSIWPIKHWTAPKYKFGYEVPCNFTHAVEIDARCRSTKWQDANKLESQSQDECKTFEDWGFTADPPKVTRKFGCIWYLTSNMMANTRHAR